MNDKFPLTALLWNYPMVCHPFTGSRILVWETPTIILCSAMEHLEGILYSIEYLHLYCFIFALPIVNYVEV